MLFSSVASLLGAPGQANYSAANAALDGMAAQLQQAGAPVVSVQWGAWAGAGMAANDAQTAARVERMGMGMVTPARGLAALEGVLAGLGAGELRRGRAAYLVHCSAYYCLCARRSGSQLTTSATRPAGTLAPAPITAANPFHWPNFLRRLPSPPALFSAFAPAAAPAAPSPARAASSSQLTLEAVEAQVAGAVQAVLGREVARGESLMEAGLDSLGAVELRNALARQFALELPATLTFDFPSVAAMAGYIAEGVGAAGARRSPGRGSSQRALLLALGVGGRMP